MRVAVVGGNLQGVEACYLAQKAGWEVVVIDKKSSVPASGLCDSIIHSDVTLESEGARWMKGVDLVIPALEDAQALSCLTQQTQAADVPFAFDPKAYAVSSSKVNSNRLFEQIGIPVPEMWPDCGFPVVAKPSNSSGSRGVQVLCSEVDYKRKEAEAGGFEDWVLQKYVQGELFSVEVIGSPGEHHAVQITDLVMDEHYDCKRVVAPTTMSPELAVEFKRLSILIAGAVELRGLMDLEVILQDKDIKVLEVDARIPSQTPTAVYWSTGLNLVRELARVFLSDSERFQFGMPSPRGAVYEHIRVSPGLLEVAGEHIMSRVDSLHAVEDFFGANEAITNYTPGRNNWVATLIISGTDREDAWSRREEAIRDIRRKFELSTYYDRGPTR